MNIKIFKEIKTTPQRLNLHFYNTSGLREVVASAGAEKIGIIYGEK